jgi:carbon-monoxide dehydrogenase large subunit
MGDPEILAQRQWTGKRRTRVEDQGMLTGATRYVSDVQLPRAVDAAFVRSTSAHARISALRTGDTSASPGVLLVLTAEDVAHLAPTTDIVDLPGAVKTPRTALPAEKVRYVGEPVACVVAVDRYAAEDGAELIEVDYEDVKPGEPVHAGLAGPVADKYFEQRLEAGAVTGHDPSDMTVARTLEFRRLVATPMESCSIIADYDAGTGDLTCYVSTQAPHLTRLGLAQALGLPASRVRVVCPAMGGAFGSKETVLPEYLCVAVAAMRLRRPVRWTEDRAEALTAGVHAKDTRGTLHGVFSPDGRIKSLHAAFTSNTGAYSCGVGSYVEFMVAAHSVPGLYRTPRYSYEVAGHVSNRAPVAPFRGVGMTTAQALRELLFDDAARALGIDRMELRRRNIIGDGPWQTVLGEDYEPGSWRTAFERALELIDYPGFPRRRAAALAEGRLLGIGVSPFVEGGAHGSAGGSGLALGAHDNATVSIDLDGKITVCVPTFSHGQGHHTTIAQLAADMFGVFVEDVRVVDGDTSRTPFGMGTYNSRSGVFAAGTVLKASVVVRDKVRSVAALLLEAAPSDLELADGAVLVRGDPEKRLPLAAVAGAAHFAPFVRAALGDPALSATAFFDPAAPTHSNGAVAAMVSVDAETGRTDIERIVAVEDCGRMLNPMIIDGQVRGGVAQGIGLALLEHFVYDESGQPLTTTFADYLIPRSTDVPPIWVEHLETPAPGSPLGVKGMAEGAAAGTPAAIICAVLDAISPQGAVIESLPVTPAMIMDALEGSTGWRSRPAG